MVSTRSSAKALVLHGGTYSGAPAPHDLASLRVEIADARRALSRPFLLMIIVSPAAPAPPPALRVAVSRFAEAIGAHVEHQYVVISTTGFLGAMQRGVASTIILLRRHRDTSVHDSIESAFLSIQARHGLSAA